MRVLVTVGLVVSSGALAAGAEPPPAQQPGAGPRWGVARTPAEVERCRADELAIATRREDRPAVEPGTTVQLRASPAALPLDGCDAVARRYNFVLDEANPGGCFVNAFADRTDTTITDRATGLMWQRTASSDLSFEEAREYVAALDARRSGGQTGWRIPTIEELMSLAETVEYRTTRLDPVLFSHENEYWTADAVAGYRARWIFGTLLPSCVPTRGGVRYPVRAVRTAGATPSVGAASPAVRWGVTRTAEEVAGCREEEVARFERREERVAVERGTSVSLRATPSTLPPGGCEAAARRYHFLLDEANPGGCFVNAFEERTEETVVDRATGLMWQREASRAFSFDRATRYVADLNARRLGGYTGWRIPTTEELLSLVETARFQTTRLDPVLFSRESEYWTADAVRGAPAQWAVDALLAACTPAQRGTELPVRAVRTAGAGR